MPESFGKHLKILKSRLHPRPIKSESLDPRPQNFLNVLIRCNMQPRLRTPALKSVCLPNYSTVLISHASKVMFQSFKLGFSSLWSKNFHMYKLDLEKADKPEIKLPASTESSKKQENSGKHLLLLYWLCQTLTVWITTNCGKFFKRWEYHSTWTESCEICMQVKK